MAVNGLGNKKMLLKTNSSLKEEARHNVYLQYSENKTYRIGTMPYCSSETELAKNIKNNNAITEQSVKDSIKQNNIKSYKALVNILRKEAEIKIRGYYLVIKYKKSYVIMRSFLKDSGEYEIITSYTPENETIRKEFEKMLIINDNNTYRILKCNKKNRYQFFGDLELFNIALIKADVDDRKEEIFYKFRIPKKSGGMREIIAPHEDIREGLRLMNNKLQLMYDKRNADFQVAYKRGKCVKNCAEIHKDKKYVYNIDLKDFYPSCKKELIVRYLEPFFDGMFNRQYFEDVFYSIILDNGGLFIGNPISGTLLNAVISNAVSYLAKMCEKYNMNLSVYADDMSFSSDKFIAKQFVLELYKTAFENYGLADYFKINHKKCEGTSAENRHVTGVSINGDNKITIGRVYYKGLRAALFNLKNGKDVDIKKLQGKIAYGTMIDESGKVIKLLQKYKDEVIKFKLCSKEIMNKYLK